MTLQNMQAAQYQKASNPINKCMEYLTDISPKTYRWLKSTLKDAQCHWLLEKGKVKLQ